MANLLKLHEAVAIILLSSSERAATFNEIANEIEKRQLFTERKGGISLAEQIRLRTSIASSKYKSWFIYTKPDILKLK